MLKELQRRKAAETLPGDPAALFAFRLRSIEMFTLSDSMFVTSETLLALQIIRTQSHPKSQVQGPDKSSSRAKERLSVYGLFHALASTFQGKTCLRRLFLRPTTDLDLIQERQRTISAFLRSENRQPLVDATKILRKIKFIRSHLFKLRKGVDAPSPRASYDSSVWAVLQHFCRHVVELCQTIRGLAGSSDLPLVMKVRCCLPYFVMPY